MCLSGHLIGVLNNVGLVLKVVGQDVYVFLKKSCGINAKRRLSVRSDEDNVGRFSLNYLLAGRATKAGERSALVVLFLTGKSRRRHKRERVPAASICSLENIRVRE